MQILTTPHDLEAQCRAWRKAGDDIALVPTMGYYHAGHEDLMTHARGLARRLVERLLTDAREEGYEAMLLDTFPFLSQAIRLYRALGFYEIPRYNSFGRSLIYMQKDLKPA